MKRWLIGLVFLSASSAYATKARLAALNQDQNGSYYIYDTRDIFLNPAELSNMKDHLNFEWGKMDRPGVYSTGTSEAEGGFVMDLGAGKLAAQLGRVSDFDNLMREMNANVTDVGTNTVGGTFGEGQNNVDVIYSGTLGSGTHWGGGVAIERSKMAEGNGFPNGEVSVQAYELRGGLSNDKWSGFANVILAGQSHTDVGAVTGKFDESIGLRAGGAYQYRPDFKFYGNLQYDKYTAQVGSAPNYSGTRYDLMGGAVYLRNLEENARMFASVELNYLTNNASDGSNANLPTEKYQYTALPVNIGVEADANSWARVRASVRQNVLIGSTKTTTGNTANDSNYWENAPNNTAVAVGLGASAQKFNFDLALAQPLTAADSTKVQVAMTFIF